MSIKDMIKDLNWKEFLVITSLVHLPQLYGMIVEGKSMNQARFFSEPDRFWTPATIALHAASLVVLFVPKQKPVGETSLYPKVCSTCKASLYGEGRGLHLGNSTQMHPAIPFGGT